MRRWCWNIRGRHLALIELASGSSCYSSFPDFVRLRAMGDRSRGQGPHRACDRGPRLFRQLAVADYCSPVRNTIAKMRVFRVPDLSEIALMLGFSRCCCVLFQGASDESLSSTLPFARRGPCAPSASCCSIRTASIRFSTVFALQAVVSGAVGRLASLCPGPRRISSHRAIAIVFQGDGVYRSRCTGSSRA